VRARRYNGPMKQDPSDQAIWIDAVIEEAEKRGEFDDLPGTGKPIPGAGTKDDDLWWVRSWLERNKDTEPE
jgi:hypothetical protein